MVDKETIDICTLKLCLVGPPHVGKTTTLNRLLQVYENIQSAGDKAKHASTLLATLQKKLINLTIFLMVKTIETEVTFINVALTKYKKRQFNFYVIIITTI